MLQSLKALERQEQDDLLTVDVILETSVNEMSHVRCMSVSCHHRLVNMGYYN